MAWILRIIACAAMIFSIVCLGTLIERNFGTSYLQRSVESAGTIGHGVSEYGVEGLDTMRNAMDELTKRFEKFTKSVEKSHRITTGEES